MSFSVKYLIKSMLTLFVATALLGSTLSAKEPTQQERNEMAAKLIPIITMLLMDDGDRVAPLEPTTGFPPPVSESSLPTNEVLIYGEVGASVYVDGVKVTTIPHSGKVTVPLTLQVGNNIIHITLKDRAGNESKALIVEMEYIEVTVLGFTRDIPIIGATVEIYDKTRTLIKKVENITNSEGGFSIGIPSYYEYEVIDASTNVHVGMDRNKLYIRVSNGQINGVPFKGTLEAICLTRDICNITPYTTLLATFSDGYRGTYLDIEPKSTVTLNRLLGIGKYPFINNNISDMNKIKHFMHENGDTINSFAQKLYADGIDGYLDIQEYIDTFINGHMRVEEELSFEVSDVTIDENSTETKEYILTSFSKEEEGTESSALSLGYPSDVVLLEKSLGGTESSIVYHAFNMGNLNGKVNAQTEVAYQIFSTHLELIFLPLEEKESIVDDLLGNDRFLEAAHLYDKLYTYESSEYIYFDTLINNIGTEILAKLDSRQLVQSQAAVAQKISSSKVKISAMLRSGTFRKLSNGIEDESVTLNINQTQNNNPFKVMDGLLLNIGKDSVGGDQIVFDFYTNIALWYGIEDKNSFFSTDTFSAMLDTNLIEPKVGAINIKAIFNSETSSLLSNDYVRDYFKVGYISTPMNIANFDSSLNTINTSKDYIVYRSKEGVLLDTPFIMNTLTVVDIVVESLSGTALVSKLKKKLKENSGWLSGAYAKASKIKDSLEGKKDYIIMADALLSTSKDVFEFMGTDTTTIDQRYGQIETLLNQIKTIVNIDEGVTGTEEEYDIQKIISFIREFIVTKQKKKKSKYNPKKILKYYVYYKLAYMIMDTYEDDILKQHNINNKLATALAVAKWKSDKTLTQTEKQLKNKWVTLKVSYVTNILKKNRSGVSYAQLAKVVGIEKLTNINNYLYKLNNLTESIDSTKIWEIVKNISIQVMKDGANSTASAIAGDIEKVLYSMVGGGYVKIAKAGNKLVPMVWDYTTKPVAVAINIKRASGTTFEVKSIIPPVFENLNYLKFTNADYMLSTTSPIVKASANRSFQTVDNQGSTNVLVMPGSEFEFNNAAIITNTDLAQGYFEKHEDDNIIFANWHVYQQDSYDFGDAIDNYAITSSTAFTNANTGNANFWEFTMTGESIDCIDSVLCSDEEEEYEIGTGNVILDTYMKEKDKADIEYFSFDKFWAAEGHKGGGTLQTPGIYSVRSDLWIGNNKEVEYQTKFNFFVVPDYDYSTSSTKSHKAVVEEQSSYQLTEEGLQLYFKLHRDDNFNYSQKWTSTDKGDTFYAYIFSASFTNTIPEVTGPFLLRLGVDAENGILISNDNVADAIKNDTAQIVIVDSILHSFLMTNNTNPSHIMNYISRKEGTTLARPFIAIDFDKLKPRVLETIEVPNTTSTLKKTGQTTSYHTGDDGTYQAGVAPSYSRSGEVVTDHITGLEWQDNAEAKTVRKNFSDAQAHCSTMTFAGGGWRLPTVQELQSIVVDGAYNPSIDTTAFVNYSTSNRYWSSTTYAGSTSGAWIVYFGNGYADYNDKSGTYYVRCVR